MCPTALPANPAVWSRVEEVADKERQLICGALETAEETGEGREMWCS